MKIGDDGPEHIGKYINQLSRRLRYASNSFLVRSGVMITGEQCRLLGYIRFRNDKGENVFQRDIEREFSVKRSSVTSILANLEKNGYILRTVDETDARTKKVTLTEKGEKLDRKMLENINRIENVLSSGMTDEEREMFLYLIKKALDNIDSSEMFNDIRENE